MDTDHLRDSGKKSARWKIREVGIGMVVGFF